MKEELIEGVNIGKLPDIFPFLTNNKIPRLKTDGDLNEDYMHMYREMEKTFLTMREIRDGEIVTGVIASKTDKEILVDFGYKDYIYVDTPKKEKISADINVGDKIEVLITHVIDNPFIIKGSITELIRHNVHNKMKQYFEQGLALTAFVKEMIPAGYMIDIHMDNITIDAFMPNTLADVNKLSDPSSVLGQTFEVMLETLQQEKGVYVVSRRKYLQTLIPKEIKKLKYNTVYKGDVTGTTPYGVFVQFNGCLTGMIYKTNINPANLDKWDQITPGLPIEFYIKEIVKNGKIILTQILKESLWDTIKVGKTLTGKVKDVKPFGALIDLDSETVGLIQTVYLKNNKTLVAGDEVRVTVISLIRDDRKIYLNFDKKDRPVEKVVQKEE